MNKDFQFRSGKYKGKTYEWVVDNDPLYIEWVSENRPEMLKEIKINKSDTKEKSVKVTNFKEEKISAIRVNENFDNEPPSAISIPYMLDNFDLYEDKLMEFSKNNKREFRLIKEEYDRKKISRM